MSLTTMYPAKNGSPATSLTSGINSSDTTMTVQDPSVLPSAPNLAVIGTADTAEIVLYTEINGSDVTIVRGQNGTVPGTWAAGTVVARNFTAADHEAFRENILDLDSRKIEGVSWGDITGMLSGQSDLNTALSAKAPLASPALTGTPTAPTAAAGTNSTQIATTAYSDTAVNKTRDQLLTFAESIRGKKVSIIGDSVSTYSGQIPSGYNTFYPTSYVPSITSVDQCWWKQMIDFCGAALEVNASYSGSAASNVRGEGYPTFYNRCAISVIGHPDVIFVALGTNDSSNNAPIGSFDFTTAYRSLSESNFATAYIKGVKALQSVFPSAQIVCCAFYMKQQYAASIRYIAKTLGCVYIDSQEFDREYGSHPGALGMKQIAANVLTLGAPKAADNGPVMGATTIIGDLYFSSDHTIDEKPSAAVNPAGFQWTGYNGDLFGYIHPRLYADGTKILQLAARNAGTDSGGTAFNTSEIFSIGINGNGVPMMQVTTPAAWQKGIMKPVEITDLAYSSLPSGLTINTLKAYRMGYMVSILYDLTLTGSISAYSYLTQKKLPLVFGQTSHVYHSALPYDVNLSTHNAKPLELRFYYSSGNTVAISIRNGAAARYVGVYTYITTVDP